MREEEEEEEGRDKVKKELRDGRDEGEGLLEPCKEAIEKRKVDRGS